MSCLLPVQSAEQPSSEGAALYAGSLKNV